MNQLTFAAWREANVARALKWHPQGLELWSTSDWIVALTGELGELAGLIKMRNRERDGLPGNKFSPTDEQVAKEAADVFTYLDLFCAREGIDLAAIAVQKFNEVSERVGFPDRIEHDTPANTPLDEFPPLKVLIPEGWKAGCKVRMTIPFAQAALGAELLVSAVDNDGWFWSETACELGVPGKGNCYQITYAELIPESAPEAVVTSSAEIAATFAADQKAEDDESARQHG